MSTCAVHAATHQDPPHARFANHVVVDNGHRERHPTALNSQVVHGKGGKYGLGTKSEKKSATESRPPGKRSKMGGSLWTSGTARCWLAACCMLELTRCGAFLGVGHAGSKYGLARPGFSPQDLRARDREPAAWPQQLPGVHALHRRHVLARCADRHSKAPEVPSKGAAGAGDERALQAVGREQRPEDSQEEAAAERRALEQKVRALEKELAAARDTAGAQGGDAEKTVLRGQVRTQRKRGLQAPAGFLGPDALDDERDYRDWEGSRSIFRQRVPPRFRLILCSCFSVVRISPSRAQEGALCMPT